MRKHFTSLLITLSIVSSMLPAQARYMGYSSYSRSYSPSFGGYNSCRNYSSYGGYNRGGYLGNGHWGGYNGGGYNRGGYLGNGHWGGYNGGGYNRGGYGNGHWGGYNGGGYNHGGYLGNGHWGGYNGGGYNRGGDYAHHGYLGHGYWGGYNGGYNRNGYLGNGYWGGLNSGYGYGNPYSYGYNPYLNPYISSAGLNPYAYGYNPYYNQTQSMWNSTWPFLLGMSGTTLAASVASSIINSSGADRYYTNSTPAYNPPMPMAQPASYAAYSAPVGYVASTVPVGYISSAGTPSGVPSGLPPIYPPYQPSLSSSAPGQPNLAYNMLPPVAPRLTGLPPFMTSPMMPPIAPMGMAFDPALRAPMSAGFVALVNDKYNGNIQHALKDPEAMNLAKSIGLVNPYSSTAPIISNQQEKQIKRILRDSIATPPDKVQSIAGVMQPAM